MVVDEFQSTRLDIDCRWCDVRCCLQSVSLNRASGADSLRTTFRKERLVRVLDVRHVHHERFASFRASNVHSVKINPGGFRTRRGSYDVDDMDECSTKYECVYM